MELPDDRLRELDAHILAGRLLPALKLIRVALGVGLNDAKVVHLARYRKLRAERPAEFALTDEEYWDGVYG